MFVFMSSSLFKVYLIFGRSRQLQTIQWLYKMDWSGGDNVYISNDQRRHLSANVADLAGTAGIDSTATAIESYTVLAMSSFVGKVIFTNSILQYRFTQLTLILITLQCLDILFVE